jgi:integrase
MKNTRSASTSRTRSSAPTVAEAVKQFIQQCEVARQKDVRSHVSVLQGTESVIGRAPAGPALAKSQLGPLRVSAHDLSLWFAARHPQSLAPSTAKRGMSSLRTFVSFCVRQGWADEQLLEACVSIAGSEPRRTWLRPEQLAAIEPLAKELDEYEYFAYRTMLSTGVRVAELLELVARDLDRREQVVRVRRGKGRGEGKARDVPVSRSFVVLWEAHVERFALRPQSPMFFHRDRQFTRGKGHWREADWILDTSARSSNKPMGRILEELTSAAQAELGLLAPEYLLTPHVLRRTFACLHAANYELGRDGWGIRTLQRAMGHSSLEVTAQYLADVETYVRKQRRTVDALEVAQSLAELARERPPTP